MSWDSYIDSLVGNSKGQADRACVIGQDGSKWTTDGHAKSLKITPAEAVTIGRACKSKDFTVFQASGIHIEGQKYQFLRSDDKLVLGKKKGLGFVSLQSSKTAVAIVHGPEGAQQGDCNTGVGSVADYLEAQNM